MSDATLVTPGNRSEKHPKAPGSRIDITSEIITKACQRDSSHCMIAEAIRKTISGARRISVDLQTIRWTDNSKGLRYVFLTPRTAQTALIGFDQGEQIAPFSFKLRGGAVHRSGNGPQKPHKIRDRVSKTKAKLVRTKEGGGSNPQVVGGKLPPSSRFARRREFGLRALGR